MAGRGPAPKDPEQRRRRNVDPVERRQVSADDVQRGPELPAGDWPAATVRWWDTWRGSPQAQVFTATDWSFLLDTALLHAELWAGNGAVAAELRLRVAKFGATPEDRARLRLEVADQTPPAKPVARKAGSRREQLLSLVDGQAG